MGVGGGSRGGLRPQRGLVTPRPHARTPPPVFPPPGIGNVRDGLHPIQAALAASHGSQCGFCTPGFVMSLYGLLRSLDGARPSLAQVEECVSGNLW